MDANISVVNNANLSNMLSFEMLFQAYRDPLSFVIYHKYNVRHSFPIIVLLLHAAGISRLSLNRSDQLYLVTSLFGRIDLRPKMIQPIGSNLWLIIFKFCSSWMHLQVRVMTREPSVVSVLWLIVSSREMELDASMWEDC